MTVWESLVYFYNASWEEKRIVFIFALGFWGYFHLMYMAGGAKRRVYFGNEWEEEQRQLALRPQSPFGRVIIYEGMLKRYKDGSAEGLKGWWFSKRKKESRILECIDELNRRIMYEKDQIRWLEGESKPDEITDCPLEEKQSIWHIDAKGKELEKDDKKPKECFYNRLTWLDIHKKKYWEGLTKWPALEFECIKDFHYDAVGMSIYLKENPEKVDIIAKNYLLGPLLLKTEWENAYIEYVDSLIEKYKRIPNHHVPEPIQPSTQESKEEVKKNLESIATKGYSVLPKDQQ